MSGLALGLLAWCHVYLVTLLNIEYHREYTFSSALKNLIMLGTERHYQNSMYFDTPRLDEFNIKSKLMNSVDKIRQKCSKLCTVKLFKVEKI